MTAVPVLALISGGFLVGLCVAAVLAANGPDDDVCPHCRDTGAVVTVNRTTRRPHPTFCGVCPLGRQLTAAAAADVDWAAIVLRAGHIDRDAS